MRPPDHPKKRIFARLAPLLVRTVVGTLAIGLSLALAVYMATSRASLKPTSTDTTISVRTMAATTKDVAPLWTGYGVARAMDVADISAQVAGLVVGRPPAIEAGGEVAAGDLIVRIDPSDFEDRLRSAEQAAAALEADLEGLDIEAERLDDQIGFAVEQVDLARDELARIEAAGGMGGATAIELIRIRQTVARQEELVSQWRRTRDLIPSRKARLRADLSARRNDVRAATRDLDRATINAPLDGSIQRVEVEVGEYVNVGQRIARVVSLDRIEIPIRIGASAFGRIRVGDEAIVRSAGPDRLEWKATVSRIAPEVEQSTRSMTVFLEIRQAMDGAGVRKGSVLLPGRFVTATLRGFTTEPRVVVPRSAIDDDRLLVLRDGDDDGRWVVDGRAVRVLYHVEGAFPDLDPHETQWAVIEGIEPGTPVVTSNLDELEPQMLVRAAGASRMTQGD